MILAELGPEAAGSIAYVVPWGLALPHHSMLWAQLGFPWSCCGFCHGSEWDDKKIFLLLYWERDYILILSLLERALGVCYSGWCFWLAKYDFFLYDMSVKLCVPAERIFFLLWLQRIEQPPWNKAHWWQIMSSKQTAAPALGWWKKENDGVYTRLH